jgi:hypothetical protein
MPLSYGMGIATFVANQYVMRVLIVVIAAIAMFTSCSKKNKVQCWVCTSPYNPNHITVCDLPGHDSDVANNHNAYLGYEAKVGYPQTCSPE